MRWMWVLCLAWVGSGYVFAQGKLIVVKIWGGETLHERSAWVQSRLNRGGVGWLIPNPALWNSPEWRPDYWLADPDVPDRPTSVPVPLAPAESFAYGIRSSPDLLSRDQRRRLASARWVQVDLGDVARANRYAKLCTREQAEQLTEQAWEQVGAWCHYLASLLREPNDRLVVLGVPKDSDGLWALFILSDAIEQGGLISDSRVSLPTVAHSESLLQLARGEMPFEIVPRAEEQDSNLLLMASTHWRAQFQMRPLQSVLLGVWTLFLLASLLPLRPKRRRPRLRVVGSAPPKSPPQLRLTKWLTAWGVWGVALSVASLFPAGFAGASGLTLVLVWLVGASVLALLVMVLDHFTLGLGALAGLGLTLLVLDSFSGGNWARDGLLGYATLGEGRTLGIGSAYGTLAVLWALLFCAVWLRIEGNPLGAMYMMAGVALWLGWRAHNLPLTLMAVVSAAALGGAVLQQEAIQRRRLRLSMMRAGRLATRTTPIPHERKLLAHLIALSIILLGAITLAPWPHTVSILENLSQNFRGLLGSGWSVVLFLSLVGLWRLRRLHSVVPEAVRYGWLGALWMALVMGLIPLSLVFFLAWAFLLSALQQETHAPMPNPKLTTGGTR